MDVIGHEYIGVYGHTEQARSILQPLEKAGVIFGIMKNNSASIAALHDMMLLMWDNESG